jgi:hypothetical protein
MNIKKIIREEIDNDLNWMMDVTDIVGNDNEELIKKFNLVKEIYKDSEFNIDFHQSYRPFAKINDKDGSNYSVLDLYDYPMVWLGRLRTDYKEAVNICGEDCDLALEYKKIYNIMAEYNNRKLIP